MVVHSANTTHSALSSAENYARPSSTHASPRLQPHAHFDLETGVSATDHAPGARQDGNFSPNGSAVSRPGTARHSFQSGGGHDTSHIPRAPIILKRRATRAGTALSNGTTARTVTASAKQKDWHAGQEPGLDPSKPNGGRQQATIRQEECQITVVDFSPDDMEMHDFDNKELIDFIQKPQEDWIKCRWINVNGISWDVIQALGKAKNLHRLAIEDLTNTESRTKVDWYTNHTFMIMTLHKLVHMHVDGADDCEEFEDEDGSLRPEQGHAARFSKFLKRTFLPKAKTAYQNEKGLVGGVHNPANGSITGHTEGVPGAPIKKLRTLQRYHGGHNEERMQYMEKHSVLTRRQMTVSAEQVSIFLTSDNTVISFFESSADDLEDPILHRLCTPDTVLRRSCDASMLLQALIDAIIDLAIPVTSAYEDIIGELELNVLMEPSIKYTSDLYIVTTEITKLRANISPTVNLINSLKDHKKARLDSDGRSKGANSGSDHSTVEISGMARTYLGDVEDHILLMTDSLDTMRRSCDNMIDLIFNTIAAYQNESMKQLTVVTIIFLPLSFLTGYFGMNFQDMPALNGSDSYLWKIAAPVAVVVILWLMKDTLKWYFVRLVQKRHVSKSRKGRLSREAEEKRRR